jgi:hypothetical protein
MSFVEKFLMVWGWIWEGVDISHPNKVEGNRVDKERNKGVGPEQVSLHHAGRVLSFRSTIGFVVRRKDVGSTVKSIIIFLNLHHFYNL